MFFLPFCCNLVKSFELHLHGKYLQIMDSLMGPVPPPPPHMVCLLRSFQNYTEESFLLRYIGDDRYINDHNFEIICTKEQRESIEKVCLSIL